MSIWTTVGVSLRIRSDKHFSLRKHVEQHLNGWDVVFSECVFNVENNHTRVECTFRFDCGGLKAAHYVEDIYKGIPVDHNVGSGEWLQFEATIGWE